MTLLRGMGVLEIDREYGKVKKTDIKIWREKY